MKESWWTYPLQVSSVGSTSFLSITTRDPDCGSCGITVAKWLGKQSFLDYLASLDPELYKGLISLKNMEGDPEDLSLNFTIAEEEFGMTKSIDLVPNGSNIVVTRANRMECACGMRAKQTRTCIDNQIAWQTYNWFATTNSTVR